MAKNSIRDFDNTAGNNTDIQSVDIAENCAPSGINNAIRELMADMADVNDGTVALVSPAMDSADINGGTIDGTVIGGTTPAAGTFTTGDFNTSLNVDGTVTSDGLTVDGSVDVNGATSFNLQTTGTNYVFNRTDAAPVLATQYNGTTNAQVFTGTDGSLSLRADPTDNLSGSYFNITVDGTTALTIDDSQNVGIGIATPSTDLHLFKTTGDVGITVQSSATANAKAFVDLYGRDASNVNQIWKIENDAHSLKIKDDGSTKMVLDTSGNLLVGETSTPADVAGLYVKNTDPDDNYAGQLGLKGTATSGAADTGAAIAFEGHNGSGNRSLGQIAVLKENSTVGNNNSYMRFSTRKNPLGNTERMRLTSDGNLGIGTSSPTVQLASGNRVLHLDSGANQGSEIKLEGNNGLLSIGNTSAGAYFYNVSNTPAIFGTNNTERMRISAAGEIGLGVTGTTGGAGDINMKGNQAIRWMHASNGTQYGDMYVDTSNNMVFRNTSSSTERMRIDSSGNLLVGTTSAVSGNECVIEGRGVGSSLFTYSPNTSYAQAIAADGSNLVFFGRGALGSVVQVGSISCTTSSTSYNTTSDYRLKENVTDITDGIERVKQLNPSRFNFIADADTTVDGFLAHEVSDIVPEAVSGEKDAMRDEEYEVTPAVLDDDGNVVTEAVMGIRSVPNYQGIDQSKLVPVLTAALQEAIAKIETLEAKVTALENA
jgi:hypothetical protein